MSTIWLIFDSHFGLLALCILGLKLSEYLDKLACFFEKIFTVDAYSTFHNRDAKCYAICFVKKYIAICFTLTVRNRLKNLDLWWQQ